MPGLLTIPRELQISIVEYLTTNRDKKNICLVCKEMAIVGTPLLYQNMVVHSDRLNSELMSTMSAPGTHYGLAHVRTLLVDSDYDLYGPDYKHPDISESTLALCTLLEAIPEDALTGFDIIANGEISGVISEILFRQQCRLTNYHFHSQSCDVPPTTALGTDPFAWLTSLQLHLRCKEDCRRAASIISRTPEITELSIRYGNEWEMRLPMSDAPYGRDCIEILFDLKETRCQLPSLRSLSLENFSLSLLGPVFSQSINFSKLEELQLLKCDDVGDMLLSLGLQQVDWKILRIEEEQTGDDSGKLRTFLQTICATEVLSITRKRWWPEDDDEGKLCWTDLVPHSATLESLRLNIEQPGEYPFHKRIDKVAADFRELCKSASNLEQLALTCPPVEEDLWQEERGFAAFLDCLASITSLKTLELSTFPNCLNRALTPGCEFRCGGFPIDHLERFSDATVDRTFTRAANKVFQTLAPSCPAFTALLFRAQEMDDHDSSDYLFAFVRSSKVDESGCTTYEAVSVQPHLLKHYEPCSDILHLNYRAITNNAEARAILACRCVDCSSGSEWETESEGGAGISDGDSDSMMG